MKPHTHVNLSVIDAYVADGLLTAGRSDVHPLLILNYTPKVQYGRLWDEVTLMCRGLIIDIQGRIVARPFGKFFNLEELTPDQLPAESFEVFEKMDGSLGILFWNGQGWQIATRGSFNSDQAVWANKFLQNQYAHVLPNLDRSLTYLFEIIYPANRIVVDYGTRQDLVLLAVVDPVTGQDRPLPNVGFPVVKRYDGLSDFRMLKALAASNAEGFVVRFVSGFRCKIKFEEYVRLHRILTGVSTIIIWEYLSEGRALDELLDRVPDEFYSWVKLTVNQLQSSFNAIIAECELVYRAFETRKEAALYFKQQRYPAILFKMLDKQPYDTIIWKAIRPKYAKPFLHADE